MAEAVIPTKTISDEKPDIEREDKKLQDIFLEGWKIYEELEVTSLAFNNPEFQEKVRASMEYFELATRIVSEIGMFSANELLDEVSTECLQYMLLPYFLGKLALKLNRDDRLKVLGVAEVYFKDYLQRCLEYELDDATKARKIETANANGGVGDSSNELAQLMRAAHARNDKIAQFRRKKELDEQIKLMKEAVQNNSVDEEVKRDFFVKFLKKGIIDANEELDNLSLEKQMVEMRNMRMSTASVVQETEARQSSSHFNIHENAHSTSHHHHHNDPHSHLARPKPKPLQPFIITRDATQKSVFGMGYPSLPVMTVGEFYQQRVQEGIFPDEDKVAKMNEAQAIAAAQDPNEKEDQEKAVVEQQVENDDPEYLERMRRMDEYKDVVRRGDGNRYNRS